MIRAQPRGHTEKRKQYISEKKIYCGKEYLEVDIVPVTNIPECDRQKKKESSEKQKRQNEKRSRRRYVQIANTNFVTGDYHLSCTYSDKHLPDTLEDAERIVHNFLRRIKRLMKKKGIELKYMLVTEYTPVADTQDIAEQDKRTKAVRIHHHIIINAGLERDELELLWSTTRINWKKARAEVAYREHVDFLGYINCDRVQLNETGLEALVNYINKRKKGCKKWSASQNLEKPKVKTNNHKFSFRKVRELARTPEDKEYWRKLYKGYEPTSIVFQYNDFTGYSCYLKLRKVRD